MKKIFFPIFSMLIGLGTNAPNGSTILGNCGELTCEELLNRIEKNFPQQIADFTTRCEADLAIEVDSDRNSAYFRCWQAPTADGQRNGSVLGRLPYPGEETRFPVQISSSDPAVQAVLNHYPEEVEQMGFDCAIQSGSVSIRAEADRVELECWFQAGMVLIDMDGDGISDGMNSRGAGVSFTYVLARPSKN